MICDFTLTWKDFLTVVWKSVCQLPDLPFLSMFVTYECSEHQTNLLKGDTSEHKMQFVNGGFFY